MENNANLKIIINYLDKSSEIYLDNNTSFEETKSNIAKELTISDEDKNNIFVKFFDIKYEKLSPQANFHLKLELFNNEKNLGLDSQNKNTKNEIEALQNDISSFQKEINSINEQYENDIKQIQNNYENFQKSIKEQNEENNKLLNNAINAISKNKDENGNMDNNINFNKSGEIFDLISQIKNEIKEMKENKDNKNNIKDEINIKDENEIFKLEGFDKIDDNVVLSGTLDKFKEQYHLKNLDIDDKAISEAYNKNNKDFFDTMTELIEISYKSKK